MRRNPRRVALLAYDGLCTFEFGILVELFGLPRPELDPWYELRVCGLTRGRLRATGGVTVEAPWTLRALDGAGTILIPGWRRPFDEVPAALVRKLCRAEAEGARVASVCSGAFALAAAGLLDGRRATTHWRYAEELASRYPEIDVDPDVLYVDEGRVLTSAGSAAGIDLGLYLVEQDHGTRVANEVARRLVVPPHREGGQRQFAVAPVEEAPEEVRLARLLDDLRDELEREHTVESMARRVGTSPRTFARRFRDATGTTPHRWLVGERVARARALLEASGEDLESIAARVGFGSAQLLRLHFRRHVGTTPSAYRSTFRGRPGA